MQFRRRLNLGQSKIQQISSWLKKVKPKTTIPKSDINIFGNDATVEAVRTISFKKPILDPANPENPPVGSIQIFEKIINLKTLILYNPDKFNYKNNTYKLLKNIKLSEIKISETEFFNTDIFIILNDGEIFDGKNYKITIDIDNYCGLFKFPIDGYPKILPEILNLNIDFGNNLSIFGGGIVASESYYFIIKNCNAYGTLINVFSSGIIGGYGGNYIVKNCNFYGDIDCLCGSGIIGVGSAWLTETCIIENCKYIGNINNYLCSGIVGINSGYFGGNLCILNCTSKCNILKDSFFGGIVGPLCGYDGFILVYNSFLEGNIGELDGKIVGPIYGNYFENIGENSLLYLINIKDDLSNIGFFSNTGAENIINIKKNETVYINNYIYNPDSELIENINPIRLIKFSKIKNAKYYIIKRYYNDDKNNIEIFDKLCGCEDLIFDFTYSLSVNKVTYLVEAYDCSKKIHTQKFVY